MAKDSIFFGQLTERRINNGDSFRVRMSYGIFSVNTTSLKSGDYLYCYKRKNGKLNKVYVGKVGETTKNDIHNATMKMSKKLNYNYEDRGV